MPLTPTDIQYFPSPAAFRKWLKANHATAAELWVGFHKRHTDKPSLTWPESVDEALCVGWIDGIRRRIDDDRYVIRFTPRRPGSNWSAVNIRRVPELRAEGRMHPRGEAAFEKHHEGKNSGYTYTKRPDRMAPEYEKVFKRNRKAWKYYEAQPPHYRRAVNHWVMSAKREETRERRLAQLIEDCAAEQWMAGMRWASRKKS